MKKIISIFLIAVCVLCFSACDKKTSEQGDTASDFDKSKYAAYMDSDYLDTLENVEVWDKMQVKITVKDYGTITLELYPDIAPVSVRNFVNLVNEDYYDGLTFHRIIKNFMIQGGDPKGDGTGGSDDSIVGEFSDNGFENNLSHTAGVISMARGSDNDSASSQFFICDADSTFLDGQYAAFGKVVDGMDVVVNIASCDTAYVCPLDGNKVKDATTVCVSCGNTMTQIAEANGYTIDKLSSYKYSPKTSVVIEKAEIVK